MARREGLLVASRQARPPPKPRPRRDRGRRLGRRWRAPTAAFSMETRRAGGVRPSRAVTAAGSLKRSVPPSGEARSGARATYPAVASRRATFLMWSTNPRFSADDDDARGTGNPPGLGQVAEHRHRAVGEGDRGRLHPGVVRRHVGSRAPAPGVDRPRLRPLRRWRRRGRGPRPGRPPARRLRRTPQASAGPLAGRSGTPPPTLPGGITPDPSSSLPPQTRVLPGSRSIASGARIRTIML